MVLNRNGIVGGPPLVRKKPRPKPVVAKIPVVANKESELEVVIIPEVLEPEEDPGRGVPVEDFTPPKDELSQEILATNESEDEVLEDLESEFEPEEDTVDLFEALEKTGVIEIELPKKTTKRKYTRRKK